ncbi:MAG: insulinase family protein [Magnetococcus sp. WYHC-3]
MMRRRRGWLASCLLGLLVWGMLGVVQAADTTEATGVESETAETAQGDSPRVAPQVSHFVTRHGLTVVVVEEHANPLVVMNVLVGGAGAHDPVERPGEAYMLGWLLNEGAGAWNSTAFMERLDDHGIRFAAETGMDLWDVEVTTLERHLDVAFEMLAASLIRPRFDADAVERARQDMAATLIQEQEEGAVLASRALMTGIYRDHPYGRSLKGQVSSLPLMTSQTLRERHATWFRGPNMVWVFAGDITPERVRRLLDRLEGLPEVPPPGVVTPTLALESPAGGTWHHQTLDVPQTNIRMGCVGITRQDPDYWALFVLDAILGGAGSYSRLNLAVREQRGLSYSVSSTFLPWMGRGPLLVALDTRNERLEEALAVVRHEMRRLLRTPPDSQELQRFLTYLTGAFPLMLDELGKLAATWGRIAYYQRGWDYLERWQERIKAVQVADLQRVATRFLDPERFTVSTVGPRAPDRKRIAALEQDLERAAAQVQSSLGASAFDSVTPRHH